MMGIKAIVSKSTEIHFIAKTIPHLSFWKSLQERLYKMGAVETHPTSCHKQNSGAHTKTTKSSNVNIDH